jgi:hypothetical protein
MNLFKDSIVEQIFKLGRSVQFSLKKYFDRNIDATSDVPIKNKSNSKLSRETLCYRSNNAILNAFD